MPAKEKTMIAKKRTGPAAPIPTIKLEPYTPKLNGWLPDRSDQEHALDEPFISLRVVPKRPRNNARLIHLATDHYQSETREPTLHRRLADGFRMLEGKPI